MAQMIICATDESTRRLADAVKRAACGKCGWIPCQCPPQGAPSHVVPHTMRDQVLNAIKGKGMSCAKKLCRG
jgi:hypothetical protein